MHAANDVRVDRQCHLALARILALVVTAAIAVLLSLLSQAAHETLPQSVVPETYVIPAIAATSLRLFR
jgi:hypothetical protein